MSKRSKSAAVAVAVIVCAAWVVAQVTPSTPPAAADKPTTAPATSGATATSPASEVAVTVNGKTISEQDVDEMLQMGMQGRPVPPAQLAQLKVQYRPRVLDILIQNLLLDEQIKKQNLTISDEEMAKEAEKELDEHLKSQNMTREQFGEQVQKATGMSLEEFMKKRSTDPMIRRIRLQAMLIEKLFPEKIKVTDEDVKKKFDEARRVRASHILIDTRQLKTDEEKAAAKKKAEEIFVEVKKPGADFAALAKEHSACPSKSQGGDLGFFARHGQMVEPFAEAAFALKPGEISNVVETQFGYHIIKTTEVETMEKAAPEIREQLKQQNIRQEVQSYAEELRKDAKIDYPKGKEPQTQPAGFGGIRPPATTPAASR